MRVRLTASNSLALTLALMSMCLLYLKFLDLVLALTGLEIEDVSTSDT